MSYSGDNGAPAVDKFARLTSLRQQIQGPLLQFGRTPRVQGADLDTLALAASAHPGLHEVRPQSYRDGPAAMGFLCALAAMAAQARPGAVIWIAQARGGLDFGRPYGPGLKGIGIDPRRVLLIDAPNDISALWVAEEAAKAGGVAAIMGQILGAVDLTAARRVHFAAAQRGVFAGLARPHQVPGLGPALTRWTAGGAPGAGQTLSQWAVPRWRVGIDRRRDGPPVPAEILEWDHVAHRVRLGALLGVQDSEIRRQTPDIRGGLRRAG
jgi:protein ImuA